MCMCVCVCVCGVCVGVALCTYRSLHTHTNYTHTHTHTDVQRSPLSRKEKMRQVGEEKHGHKKLSPSTDLTDAVYKCCRRSKDVTPTWAFSANRPKLPRGTNSIVFWHWRMPATNINCKHELHHSRTSLLRYDHPQNSATAVLKDRCSLVRGSFPWN